MDKKKKIQFVEAKSIAWKRRKNIQRAGVIFYFFDETADKEIYFILGLDRKFEEWTDFGGSVNVGENGSEAAYREMKEETLDVFQPLIEQMLHQGIVHEKGPQGIIYEKGNQDEGIKRHAETKDTEGGVKYMIEKSHAIIEPNMVIIFMPLPIRSKQEFITYREQYLMKVQELNSIVENIEINAFTLPEFDNLVTSNNTSNTSNTTNTTNESIVEHKMYEKTALLIRKKLFDLKHWAKPINYDINSPKSPTK